MNRRGDVSVGILVLLAVMVAGFALFSFYQNSGRDVVTISDAKFIDNSYMKENSIRYYIQDALENSVIESYKQAIADSDFKSAGDKTAFEKEMNDKIKLNFKNEIAGMNLGSDAVTDSFKSLVAGDKFNVAYSNGKASISLDSLEIPSTLVMQEGKYVPLWKFIPSPSKAEEVVQLIGVLYKPKISESTTLNLNGLENYDSIVNAIDSCAGKKVDELQKCLVDKLNLVDVSVGESNGQQIINFETNNKFKIGKTFETIKFTASLP